MLFITLNTFYKYKDKRAKEKEFTIAIFVFIFSSNCDRMTLSSTPDVTRYFQQQ